MLATHSGEFVSKELRLKKVLYAPTVTERLLSE
jgi:hypothetical protein